MILPHTPAAEAMQLAERIRQVVADRPFEIGAGQSIPVSVSIGVSELEANRYADLANPSLQLIEGADKAVYQAKNNGRNCVCLANL